MASSKAPDYEAIERDYRAGVLSIRELGRLHNISDKAIRNKAKDKGWQRDLTDKVKEAAKSALVRADSAAEQPFEIHDISPDDQQVVDRNAAIIVNVVLGHRRMIGRLNAIVGTLADQLEQAASGREELEAEIEVMTADDETGKRRSQLLKAVSLSTHATSIVNLTNATKNLHGLERQAFNIGDEPPAASDSLTALLDHIKTTGSRLPIKPQGDKP